MLGRTGPSLHRGESDKRSCLGYHCGLLRVFRITIRSYPPDTLATPCAQFYISHGRLIVHCSPSAARGQAACHGNLSRQLPTTSGLILSPCPTMNHAPVIARSLPDNNGWFSSSYLRTIVLVTCRSQYQLILPYDSDDQVACPPRKYSSTAKTTTLPLGVVAVIRAARSRSRVLTKELVVVAVANILKYITRVSET